MITLEKAKSIAQNEMNKFKLVSIVDRGEYWVFGFRDENNMPIAEPPISISKKDGMVDIFFPPAHMNELNKGIKIL